MDAETETEHARLGKIKAQSLCLVRKHLYCSGVVDSLTGVGGKKPEITTHPFILISLPGNFKDNWELKQLIEDRVNRSNTIVCFSLSE